VKRKDLLYSFGVPVHNQLSLLLWVCGEAAQHSESAWWKKPCIFEPQNKKKRMRRGLGPTITFKGTPLIT
jgi:hypothetical protein